jgi:hypothetical protein
MDFGNAGSGFRRYRLNVEREREIEREETENNEENRHKALSECQMNRGNKERIQKRQREA